MIFLRSMAIWFIFITIAKRCLEQIASLNGTVRTLWLVPLLGDLRAHQLSFITGSLLIVTIATIFIRWIEATSLAQLTIVGVLWMLLT